MRNIGSGNNHAHRLHKAKFPPWHRLSEVRPPGKVFLNYNNYSFSNSAEIGKFKEAMPGREFCFMKSVSVVISTPYVAHDLREFVESLHKISLGSLYFHVFESRLRLGRGLNDFTIWLQDSLEESGLGGGKA